MGLVIWSSATKILCDSSGTMQSHTSDPHSASLLFLKSSSLKIRKEIKLSATQNISEQLQINIRNDLGSLQFIPQWHSGYRHTPAAHRSFVLTGQVPAGSAAELPTPEEIRGWRWAMRLCCWSVGIGCWKYGPEGVESEVHIPFAFGGNRISHTGCCLLNKAPAQPRIQDNNKGRWRPENFLICPVSWIPGYPTHVLSADTPQYHDTFILTHVPLSAAREWQLWTWTAHILFNLQREHLLCPSAVSPESLIDFESVLRCIPGSMETWQSNQRPALLSEHHSTAWPWIWGLWCSTQGSVET